MNGMTRTSALHAVCRRSRGLTLVEILVALLILSIGLLGLAGLQTLSLKFNTSAYQRTQAIALAYNMTDRMRANRQAALDDLYNVDFGNPQNCAAPDGTGTVPQQDLSTWRMELACRLPQSTGSIVRKAGTDEFTVIVRWDDDRAEDQDPVNMMKFEFTTEL